MEKVFTFALVGSIPAVLTMPASSPASGPVASPADHLNEMRLYQPKGGKKEICIYIHIYFSSKYIPLVVFFEPPNTRRKPIFDMKGILDVF